ncbi:MAG: AarF/ABC1/UbiB kinase family protein [Chloroflexi bacterium]|nr:AarF/ABC1/UbiB kinase family protein [Chloroflexota bacterium]
MPELSHIACSDDQIRLDSPTVPHKDEHDNPSASGVLASMPRRQQITVDAGRNKYEGLPRMHYIRGVKVNIIQVLSRLRLWLYALAFFSGGTLLDWVLNRNTIERRAVRLRRAFEKVGGTFIKLGQQLSIRVDILPYAYCVELSKLLDEIEPFPTEEAVRAVERVTGKPLSETFELFDPEPIGSASIACVYQAILKNGDKVAVKVRRPNIREEFAADLKALDWVLEAAEFLAIIRPGFTHNPRQELHDTLMEELDFYKEARYQSLFRQSAKKARRRYFSAPGLYFDLSGEDVIVQEFVSGFWLSELLVAIECNDQKALATFRQRNIDPKIVARRLLWISYWGLWENLFFHADPHPANVLVQPDNKIVFVDFGSGGSFSRSRRLALHAINDLESKDDIEGAARVSLTFMEPLPPIDVDMVLKEIEAEYLHTLSGMRTKESQWWEKTSAQLWLGFFRVSNKHQIPLSIGTVRMIRATLLYDTLALRLDHSIDLRQVYAKYRKGVGKVARKRTHKKIERLLSRGFDEMDYLRLEEVIDLGSRTLYRSQRLLDSHPFNSVAMLSKSIVVLFETARFAISSLITIALTATLLAGFQRLIYGSKVNLRQTIIGVVSHGGFQAFILILILIDVRRVYLRLKDKE